MTTLHSNSPNFADVETEEQKPGKLSASALILLTLEHREPIFSTTTAQLIVKPHNKPQGEFFLKKVQVEMIMNSKLIKRKNNILRYKNIQNHVKIPITVVF